MTVTTSHNNAGHEQNEKAIALMLSYIRDELEGDLKEKVAKAIIQCSSYRDLYFELKEFEDPVANLCYDLNHEEQLEKTSVMMTELANLHAPIPGVSSHTPQTLHPQTEHAKFDEDLPILS